jgi:hypothetical protein
MYGKMHLDIVRRAQGMAEQLKQMDVYRTMAKPQYAILNEYKKYSSWQSFGIDKQLLQAPAPGLRDARANFELLKASNWHLHKVDIESYQAAAEHLKTSIEKFRQALITPALETLKFGRFQELAQQQQFLDSCHASDWVPHPLLFRWLGDAPVDETTEETLKSNWSVIATDLTASSRPSVMNPHRCECMRQLLAAQGQGLHLLVCRTAYPEIEALAREYAFNDPELRDAIASLPAKKQAAELQKVKNSYFDKDTSPLLQLAIDEVGGMLGFEVAMMLFEKVFASCWTEHDLPLEDRAVSRHYHAHGYPLDATFKHGLNALLLLDVAMDGFDQLNQSTRL